MNLSKDTLLDMYYAMLRSRRLDERAWVLHRQGKIVFHISGMGHEASQIGAAFALRRGADWLAPYYRDLGLMLCFGLTPREFMLSLFGKQGEVSSGARQMQVSRMRTSRSCVTAPIAGSPVCGYSSAVLVL